MLKQMKDTVVMHSSAEHTVMQDSIKAIMTDTKIRKIPEGAQVAGDETYQEFKLLELFEFQK